MSLESKIKIGKEDGYIEYLSALLFLSASIISLNLVSRSNRPSEKMWYGVLAIGLFFIAGEEISWGQRIFNIDTFEFMRYQNVQNENNLHNLSGYLADHIFIAGVFVFGFVMPLISHHKQFFRKLMHYFGIALPSYPLAFGFLLASLFHPWTVSPLIDHSNLVRPEEVREFLCSFGFVLYTIERWRNLSSEQPISTS
jgi:hypothetical protein